MIVESNSPSSCVWNSLGKAASVPGSLEIGLEAGIKSTLATPDTAKNLQESKKSSI